MKDTIINVLDHLEHHHNMKVLFAVESGSRAWGFDSPDSDWDVRYIYVRDPDWYLSIDEGRDVLDQYHAMDCIKGHPEFDDPLLDVTGWDIKKALKLLRKSNPQISEWLRSPIVYHNRELVSLSIVESQMLDLYPAQEHYRSMAKSNFREFLQGPTVRYKKYLYVLRPLLCAQYVRQFGEFPPVLFADVMAQVLPTYEDGVQVRDALDRLLEVKMQSSEVDAAPRDPVLHAFIEREIERKDGITATTRLDPTQHLNAYFRDIIHGYY